MNQDFPAWCKELRDMPDSVFFRGSLTALHNAMLAHIAKLEVENERLRADVTALLTGNFDQWAEE